MSDENTTNKQDIINKVSLITESFSGLLYEAVMVYKTVIITFIKEATLQELSQIRSALDRTATHLVRAWKAAQGAIGPAQAIFDRAAERLEESEDLERINEKMNNLAEQMLQDGEELYETVAPALNIADANAMREFQTNGRASNEETEMVAGLIDQASQHSLEAEVLASYTKQRSNGLGHEKAAAKALGEWDL